MTGRRKKNDREKRDGGQRKEGRGGTDTVQPEEALRAKRCVCLLLN